MYCSISGYGIRSIGDVEFPDNDTNGCVEAVLRFLVPGAICTVRLALFHPRGQDVFRWSRVVFGKGVDEFSCYCRDVDRVLVSGSLFGGAGHAH